MHYCKRTKIPFNAETGEFAKSNDKSTWSSYETAVNAKGVDGIGFFFEPPYLGIASLNSLTMLSNLSPCLNL
jgi:primase-polymerase (primpol)-like protein